MEQKPKAQGLDLGRKLMMTYYMGKLVLQHSGHIASEAGVPSFTTPRTHVVAKTAISREFRIKKARMIAQAVKQRQPRPTFEKARISPVTRYWHKKRTLAVAAGLRTAVCLKQGRKQKKIVLDA